MTHDMETLLREADAGEAGASAELFAALYAELHRLAERQLRRGGAALSLNTTTLLHEAYLDMAGRDAARFPDRARFMGYAARAMRGLIVDYARRSRAQKRGGDAVIVTLPDDGSEVPAAAWLGDRAAELERLSDGLAELTDADPALAELVELHFFCGFGFAEIAELRGVSERTVQRDWRKARLFLHEALR